MFKKKLNKVWIYQAVFSFTSGVPLALQDVGQSGISRVL